MTTAINANPTPETWRHVKLVPAVGGRWSIVSLGSGCSFDLLAWRAAGLALGDETYDLDAVEALRIGAKLERFLAGNTHRR